MNNESFFNFGDVVKLKRDSEYNDLKANDCGIVWAVYAAYVDESRTKLDFDYEGTFWNKENKDYDEMFEENNAEKVIDLNEVPFTEDMKNFWLYLNQSEK